MLAAPDTGINTAELARLWRRLQPLAIAVGRETLRQWMIEAGLWRDRKQRKRIHQPRPRRECVGELVQVDGSEHWWFEDRGPQCTLLVFVDDRHQPADAP